ncbi:MAG: DinB family protein [Dehalococcoidia bacterium]
MRDKLALLMYQSWADLDTAADGIASGDATHRHDGGSSIAWTTGHVTNMVDSWLNVRFQALSPHPLISDTDFRTGGGGEATDWPLILAGVKEVREAARRFLDAEPDLDSVVPYDGSIAYLRPVGLSLRYALMRIAAHHFVHVGEIVTIRSHLGHMVDFPEWGRTLV